MRWMLNYFLWMKDLERGSLEQYLHVFPGRYVVSPRVYYVAALPPGTASLRTTLFFPALLAP